MTDQTFPLATDRTDAMPVRAATDPFVVAFYEDVLPRDRRGITDVELAAFGVTFGVARDDLFVQARLPEGWSKLALIGFHDTLALTDETGDIRATIVCKDGIARGARLHWLTEAERDTLALVTATGGVAVAGVDVAEAATDAE